MQGKQEGKEKEGVEGKKNLIKKIGLKERRQRMPQTYITCKNQTKKKKQKFHQTKAKNYKQPLSFKYVTSKLNKNSRTKVF
jgi:hypothetical protein